MSNILLLSIRPEYAQKIFQEKTKKVELRRVRPRLENDDIVVVYVSSPIKAVVGYFKVIKVVREPIAYLWEMVADKAGVTPEEFYNYYRGVEVGVGIFFKHIRPFKKPIELERLRQELSNFRPPQSYRYLEPIDWNIIKDIGNC